MAEESKSKLDELLEISTFMHGIFVIHSTYTLHTYGSLCMGMKDGKVQNVCMFCTYQVFVASALQQLLIQAFGLVNANFKCFLNGTQ